MFFYCDHLSSSSLFIFVLNKWNMKMGNVILFKWNESGFRPPLCTYRLNWARRTSWGWWLRWHCPSDMGFETQAPAVWGRARYLAVTEAPHNTDFHTWMGKKHFLFLSNRRDRKPNSGVFSIPDIFGCGVGQTDSYSEYIQVWSGKG